VMNVNGGGTVATLTLTGTAGAHTNAADVANLTITFLDGAFTNTTLAANVTDSSNNTGAIDFIDLGTGTLTYGSSTFTEAVSNNGAIGNSISMTLSGDNFAASLSVGSNVTVSNLPAGLTASITRDSATTATLTLTGNATAHANAQDIANLTVVFADSAFATLPALNITNSTKSDIGVDFADAATATLTYSTSTFTEAIANNGTIGNTASVTISGGGTFGATLTAGVDVVFTNVPVGLTANITRTSATTATITLSGTAGSHANAQDIANLTATWADSAFLGVLAANVAGTPKSDFIVDYSDQPSIAYFGSFAESVSNDGSVTGSITATLTGDTYVTPLGTVHAVVSNIPAGLTAVVTRTSATVATITLTGNATSHLNTDDIANLTITWQDGSFTNTTLASNVTTNTYSTGTVDFIDVASIIWSSNFVETAANNGSVSGSRVATLVADTYTAGVTTGANFVQGVHYTVANVPAGLSATLTKTSSTIATLTLVGTASSHADANDVSNLTVTFLDGAFTTTGTASGVAGYTNTTGSIDFNDQPSIVWTGSFAEGAANNGSITGSRVAVLTGDTYVATLNEGVHYTITNKPAGLTAAMARTSATVATLTFTGNATTHTNAQDIANLTITWLDGAFTTTTLASSVTDYTDATGAVDFVDPGTGSITYDTGTFDEAGANDGSIGNSIIATLAGDTYAGALTLGGNVTITNVPVGLTASITRTNATVATITLTGNATAHATAQDIANLTVVFADAAFSSLPAASVTGSTKNNIIVDFDDPATGTLTYGSSAFAESSALNGTIGNSIVITLSGDTFVPVLTVGGNVTVSNVPGGLTASITRDSATQATLSLAGAAGAHTNAADISNLTVVFQNTAFTAIPASLITNSTKNNIVVDFGDASITYSGLGFTEATSNNGTVTGSIIATLAGDTWAGGLTAGDVTITGTPAGLTAVVTRTSATVATITLTGTATTPTDVNDVTDLQFVWANGAFNTVAAANVAGATGPASTGRGVDFIDASLAYSATTWVEAAANNGAITTTNTITLTGDTFVIPLGNLTQNVHFTAANVPTGLTPILTITSATTVNVSFSGNAASHASAQDVSNITIAFLNAAFTNVQASTVTDSTNSSLAIDFADQPSVLYSGSFAESVNNDGSVTGSRIASLVGDTYAATLTEGVHYTLANKPAGLTAVMTRTNATTATLTFTGNAATHANTNDVSALTITWQNGAFVATTTASNVTGYSDTTGVVDFTDGASIAYSATTFTEASALNGSIGNTFTLTLTGDTFTRSSGTFVGTGVEYTASNVPAGLTMVITATSSTTATVALTGTAAAHTSAQDITNLGITFTNAAFTLTPAAAVGNAVRTDLGVDFGDATILYSGAGFTESSTNDGSVTGSIIATISGATFTNAGGTLTSGVDATIGNIPAGLTPILSVNGAGTSVTLTLTGNAASHVSGSNVSDITFAFTNSAINVVPAANTAGATGPASSNLGLSFFDVGITYSGLGFTESGSNDGSVTGSIIATLTGDTFVSPLGTVHANITNLPLGLTPVITRTSPTVATITLTGTATNHSNLHDVNNLTITWQDGAFTSTPLVANVANSTLTTGTIDFIDVGLVTWSGNFTETGANGGAVIGSRTATLTAETYTASVTTGTAFIQATHYTVANVPAGLTAVLTKTSATVATLTLTGNASGNVNADDVSNLTVTFLDGAFTTTPVASNLAGYTNTTGTIDFNDQPSIVYSGSFAETAGNTGAVTGSQIAILTGDTFAATLTEGVHYSLTNVPAGLSAVMTRTSPTVATLTFTGSAATHLNANDVTNLGITWQDGAFTTTTTAANVTGYQDVSGIIDFVDPGSRSLAYDVTTFTEAVANNGSIGNGVVITLAGDTFGPTLTLNTDVTVTNVPAGLTANVVRTDANTATITLTGTATVHATANDIANLTITFANSAFTGGAAATVTNFSKNNLVVDFNDPATGSLAYDATTFTESATLNGSIGNTLNVTLTGDDFAATLTAGVNVVFTNVPAGLTGAVTRVDATHATLTLTGTATAHADGNDIANVQVAFTDAAFATIPAALITNATVSTIGVDFGDASITYSGTGFAEAVSNNGTVTGSIVSTLAGDVFTTSVATSSTFTAATHYTIANVPAGLTAVLTKTSPTVATLTLTGTATTSTNAVDVASINITWLDAAFNTVLATNVAGAATSSGLGVDFFDVSLAYTSGAFAEALANNGSITATDTITLTGDTFIIPLGNLTAGVHYTASNVPAGLTAVVTATSANTATLGFTGNATLHADVNDLANVTLTFLTPAFSHVVASSVTGVTKSDISIDFIDVGLVTWSGNFTETGANGGAVIGSRTATLTAETYTASVTTGTAFIQATHYTVANVPAGLTAVLTKTSATVATLTLTGNASGNVNADDVSNLTVTFLDGAFTTTPVASNLAGYTNTTGTIDFNDQPSIVYSGSFAETAGNTGAVTGSQIAILTGDTFAATLTEGVHYSLTNVPAGLSAVMTRTSPTVATLTFTGSAATHLNANDVTNLGITWQDGAFTTTTTAANVTGYQDVSGIIDFVDPGSRSLAYDVTTFTEAVANNGSIGNGVVITLAGDTFGPTLTLNTDVTVTNVPAGLTANVVRTDANTATITLTGTATVHATANDIANLTITFANSAFTGGAAATVTNFSKNNLVVDFNDPATGSLAYDATTFTESATLNGSIGNTLNVTLTGDDFAATLTAGVNVVFTNVPAGLTGAVTRVDATHATLTLTGTATAHADGNDIANVQVAFTDAAFATIPAALITNATVSTIGVDFGDASITYSGTGFAEAVSNNGTVTGSIVSTLAGDVFTTSVATSSTFTAATHYTIANVPAGLTAVLTKTSPTVATLTLTGTATTSTNAVDVASINITWLDAAFNTVLATNVAGAATSSGLGVDFFDVELVYGGTTWTEALGKQRYNTVHHNQLHLTGDTFIIPLGNSDKRYSLYSSKCPSRS
jgi:hypothetical protein